jgi:AcrR family transcriptional regulator
VPKVSEEYKNKKRQELLISAIKCFGEKGYQTTTIDDIVKDSKMSKGSVYNYFKNKEELYLTLFQQSAKSSIDNLKEEVHQKDKPEEMLQHLFNFYSNINVSDKEWLKMQRVQGEFWSYASRNEELRCLLNEHSRNYVDFIATIIEDGKKSGDFRNDIDGDILAEIFLSLADGMINHLLVLQDKYPYEELYELAEAMFTSYVRK